MDGKTRDIMTRETGDGRCIGDATSQANSELEALNNPQRFISSFCPSFLQSFSLSFFSVLFSLSCSIWSRRMAERLMSGEPMLEEIVAWHIPQQKTKQQEHLE